MDRFDAVHPLLRGARAELVDQWLPESPPSGIVMAEYAHALCASIEEWSNTQRNAIGDVIEVSLKHGDDAVRDAVATCFLEALQAHASAGQFNFMEISAFLGKNAKDYCRAWDVFTGVRTPGLW